MPKYIDKEVLLNKMQERHDDLARDYGDYDNYVMGFADAIELLENAPEINEQGILRGHWIGKPISGYADCKCSVCGAICSVHASVGIPTQRYCYRCGAKMLEDE